MAEKSLFVDLVNKYFPRFDNFIELFNEKKNAPTYLFEEMLRTRYSADMNWESSTLHSSIVAADVVSMDSELPLKKRDAISHASGELPKLGMKRQLREKEIADIQVMQARGIAPATIASKVLNDAVACANGIRARLEIMFLQALSEGVTSIEDDNNVGTAIRVQFNYKDDHKYGVAHTWDAKSATPITDIKNVIDKANADGNTITLVAMDKRAYDKMRYSKEAKMMAATFAGLVVTNENNLPVLTPTRFNEAFKDETGCDILVIDKSVKVEKNGVRKTIRPWNENKVVFLPDNMVGELVYGTLPEESRMNEEGNNIAYTKANEYTLIKKWFTPEPYAEFTASQALVLPVIENVDSIYQMDITEASEDETEGDSKITLKGNEYTRASVVAALNELGITVINDDTDADIVAKFNRLNATDKAKVLAACVAPSV